MQVREEIIPHLSRPKIQQMIITKMPEVIRALITLSNYLEVGISAIFL